jgi:hypothetical protein
MTDNSRTEELEDLDLMHVRHRAMRIIRELEARIAELEAERDKALRDSAEWQLSAEMACQCPPDGCDCCGCQYAAELHELKETDE